MRTNLLYLGLVFMAFFSACRGPEVDTVRPTMQVLSTSHPIQPILLCGATEPNGILLDSEDSLVIELKFTDDRALGEYKVDIHHNFDCHGHRSPAVQPDVWSVLQIRPLTGTEVLERVVLRPPTRVAAGDYHFQVKVLDEVGNELAENDFYTIRLRNSLDTLPPTLSLVQPQGNASLSNSNLRLSLEANIADNLDLAGGRLELVYYTLSGNRVLALTELWPAGTAASTAFQGHFDFPATLPPGRYSFELWAYDALRNAAVATWEVERL